MRFNPVNYIRNKSLRWRIMVSIAIAIMMLTAGIITTTRISFFFIQNLGSSYKSNTELTEFSQFITSTEKAMENYINYRTFESIDAYYNSRTKVEDYYEQFQDFPSKNEVEIYEPVGAGTDSAALCELRYLWSDNPEIINLYTKDEIPVGPFNISL